MWLFGPWTIKNCALDGNRTVITQGWNNDLGKRYASTIWWTDWIIIRTALATRKLDLIIQNAKLKSYRVNLESRIWLESFEARLYEPVALVNKWLAYQAR